MEKINIKNMEKKYKVEYIDCGGGGLELDGGVKVFEVNSFEELMSKIGRAHV